MDKKEIEALSEVLLDYYYYCVGLFSRGHANREIDEVFSLIDEVELEDKTKNGFYLLTDMDAAFIKSLKPDARKSVNRLFEIYKDRQREYIISCFYHIDKVAGKNTLLTEAVESILKCKPLFS